MTITTFTRRFKGLPGRVACLVWALAVCVLAVLMAAAPALALTTEKTTGRGTNSSGDVVLGGQPTRFTWEGTVGEGEELTALDFTFPEGTVAT